MSSLLVSLLLCIYFMHSNIQSPFVEFAFHKFTQIWHTIEAMSVVLGQMLNYASMLLLSGLKTSN